MAERLDAPGSGVVPGGSQGNVFQGWIWLSSAWIDGWTIVGMRDFNGDGSLISCGRTMRRSKSSCGTWAALKGTRWWAATGWRKTVSPVGMLSPPGTSTGTANQTWCGRTTLDKWSCGTWAVPRAILSYGGIGCRQLDTGWRVVGTGDFNGDGRLDLVWQYDWTRQAVVWYMGGAQGNTFLWWEWLSSTEVWGWDLVGTADFNGDSKPDLVVAERRNAPIGGVVTGGGAQGNSYLGWDWLVSDPVPGWRVIAPLVQSS